jgi:hypothetical protein
MPTISLLRLKQQLDWDSRFFEDKYLTSADKFCLFKRQICRWHGPILIESDFLCWLLGGLIHHGPLWRVVIYNSSQTIYILEMDIKNHRFPPSNSIFFITIFNFKASKSTCNFAIFGTSNFPAKIYFFGREDSITR